MKSSARKSLSVKNEQLNQLLLVRCNMTVLRKVIKNFDQIIITKGIDVYITIKKRHWGIKLQRIMETEGVKYNLLVVKSKLLV